MTLRGACILLTCAATAACGGGGGGEDAAEARAPAPAQRAERPLPPAGFGTLRQDVFTVRLRTGDLQIKVTPLVEPVIRMAAPDTYERLRELAVTHEEWAAAAAARAGLQDRPLLFLVSFFTFAPQSEYTPTDLQIQSQGRLYRPLDVNPVTPGFGAQLLRQEETQIAVYAFEPEIDLAIPMTVRYGTVASHAWESIISILETERARVLARTKSEGTN